MGEHEISIGKHDMKWSGFQFIENSVYIHSCKMVLWPIRACVLFALFYNSFCCLLCKVSKEFCHLCTSLSALKKSCTVRSELKFYWLFLIDYGVSLYINFALAFQLSIPSTAHRKLTLSIYHQILTSNNVVCSSSYKEENIYKSNMLL